MSSTLNPKTKGHRSASIFAGLAAAMIALFGCEFTSRGDTVQEEQRVKLTLYTFHHEESSERVWREWCEMLDDAMRKLPALVSQGDVKLEHSLAYLKRLNTQIKGD